MSNQSKSNALYCEWGRIITRTRKHLGINIQDLCESLDMSTVTIGKVEKGQTR